MDKNIRKIIEALEDQTLNPGWRVERGAKHFKAYPADKSKALIRIATTPGDMKRGGRGLQNLKAELRRAGARGI